MSLTIPIQVSEDEEREIEVTWYRIHPPDKGGKYCPPCPAELEELEARWGDTKKSLTEEEWGKFIESNWEVIEDAVCEYDTSVR